MFILMIVYFWKQNLETKAALAKWSVTYRLIYIMTYWQTDFDTEKLIEEQNSFLKNIWSKVSFLGSNYWKSWDLGWKSMFKTLKYTQYIKTHIRTQTHTKTYTHTHTNTHTHTQTYTVQHYQFWNWNEIYQLWREFYEISRNTQTH